MAKMCFSSQSGRFIYMQKLKKNEKKMNMGGA